MTVDIEIHNQVLQIADSHHPDFAELIRLNLSNLSNQTIDAEKLSLQSKHESECFQFFARTVVGQLLSTKAASTIWQRLVQLASSNSVALSELFHQKYEEDVRACGLSRNKYRAICELANELEDNKYFTAQLLTSDYAQIKTKVTAIWGFGEWSADMCAIFFCAQPDVFPPKDVAIMNGLKKLCAEEPPAVAATRYSPYRSYLCKHIWLGFNTGYIK